MPRESTDAWMEVARSVTDLGAQIREHFRNRVEDQGESSETSGRDLADAVEVMARQVGSAFETMGEAFHDRIVREQAVRASRAFADAVEASMSDLGDEVKQARERIRHRRDE
ncbi:MAG: hypothetical protein WCB85_13230 [Candidatus Dormiibacterota bacterium]